MKMLLINKNHCLFRCLSLKKVSCNTVWMGRLLRKDMHERYFNGLTRNRPFKQCTYWCTEHLLNRPTIH